MPIVGLFVARPRWFAHPASPRAARIASPQSATDSADAERDGDGVEDAAAPAMASAEPRSGETGIAFPASNVSEPATTVSATADALSVTFGAPPRPRRVKRLRKDLRASAIDGTAFNLMVGLGETYLPAFILALGLGEIAAGMVVAIPLLVGATLQLIAPAGVCWLGSNRLWVVSCALVQGACFLPLAAMAWWGTHPDWFVALLVGSYAIASVYWGAGLAGGPPWNSWIETIVPLRVRASFFAWRSRLGQAGLLVGFVAGGLLLDAARARGAVLPAFAAIFVAASLCRFVSARYLARHGERKPALDLQLTVSMTEVVRRMLTRGRHERVLLFFLAMQWAVQISGPYFNPYMLGQIGISYFNYMLLVAASFAGKIVAYPMCGRLAYRYGTRRLLYVGSIGIFPLAGMWLYATEFPAMIALQFVGGMTWAAFELATLLTFFEKVRKDERTSILTVFNFLHSAALVGGSLVGGALISWLGKNPHAYLAVFALSSCVRVLVLAGLHWGMGGGTDTPRPSASEPEAPDAEAPPIAAGNASILVRVTRPTRAAG
jgi:MFS family permease